MSVTLEDLQPFIEKEAVLHLVQDDNSLKEITGTIKVATVAGIAFKEKGKSGLDLIDSIDKIEEISLAPVKPKPVTQKKIQPIQLGGARQHLVDRHGVELEWAKNADETEAFKYHETLDHTNLGHVHVEKKEKEKDEREQALTDDES